MKVPAFCPIRPIVETTENWKPTSTRQSMAKKKNKTRKNNKPDRAHGENLKTEEAMSGFSNFSREEYADDIVFLLRSSPRISEGTGLRDGVRGPDRHVHVRHGGGTGVRGHRSRALVLFQERHGGDQGPGGQHRNFPDTAGVSCGIHTLPNRGGGCQASHHRRIAPKK